MKKLLVGLTLLMSTPSFAACDLDEANFLIDYGMGESANNDCLTDGIGLKIFSEAREHFASVYNDSECSGNFEPRVQAYLECSAMSIANACVDKKKEQVHLNCSKLL